MSEEIIKIYTDGACSGNPGKGGWGAVLLYKGHKKEISGFNPQTTNNQMELQAVIEALKALKKPSEIIVYTDSVYVKDGITKWIFNWKKNGWRTADKKPVKNLEFWQELDLLVVGHQITWQWVKGHSGDKYNEIADQLAVNAISLHQ
jgi:ribonuclease HI